MGWLSRKHALRMAGKLRGWTGGARAKLDEKRHAAPDCGKPKRVIFIDEKGHVLLGHDTMHRHRLARRWRTRMRIKARRSVQ